MRACQPAEVVLRHSDSVDRVSDQRCAVSRLRTRRTICAGAVDGEPASNGGFGFYSNPSWIASAIRRSANSDARYKAMSMPAETPADVTTLPSTT